MNRHNLERAEHFEANPRGRVAGLLTIIGGADGRGSSAPRRTVESGISIAPQSLVRSDAMPFEIRPERPADAAAIQSVHEASFPSPLEGKLVGLLRAAGRLTISLVGCVDGEVVGHVAFSPVTAGDAIGLGLAPVGVLEPFRRQGIASRLVEAGLAAARGLPFGYAVVLGDPQFYSRFGFRAAPAYGLADEYGGGDAFQVLALRPDGIPREAGTVRYAPEFGMFLDS